MSSVVSELMNLDVRIVARFTNNSLSGQGPADFRVYDTWTLVCGGGDWSFVGGGFGEGSRLGGC